MRLSIVTTLYCSAPHVAEFHARASRAARELVGEDYEIVMVNDGSPDNALAVAREIAARDPRLKVIDFSRNFGHHRAMMAGLEYAAGQRIFLIDVDLEEQPELLLPFWRELEQSGADMIYGVQGKRRGGWFERASGELYYRVFSWLTDLPQPKNQVTARLMSARLKDAIIRHQERNIVFNCLFALAGFDQRPLPVKKASSSPSTYTLRRKLALAFNSVTSFSEKPLRMMFGLGLAIFSISLAVSCWLLLKKFVFGIALEGWVSIMMSIWLLGGLVISQIGLVGLYIAKIFIESKRRPPYIVREIICREDK